MAAKIRILLEECHYNLLLDDINSKEELEKEAYSLSLTRDIEWVLMHEWDMLAELEKRYDMKLLREYNGEARGLFTDDLRFKLPETEHDAYVFELDYRVR